MRTNATPNDYAAIASSHRQKRVWLTAVICLAALVVLGTIAALMMPASAMTAQGEATPETALAAAVETETTVPAETTADAIAEQATAETAALPQAAQVPEGYTVQRTVRDEENGFAVTVYAPEGVIQDDAVLCASLLSQEDEKYQKASEELAEQTDLLPVDAADSAAVKSQNAESDTETPAVGFAALDIHFEDADGNEVEPNGEVFVSIDAAGLIPEDADPESVTVQHHEELDDEAVVVETVADTADETEGVVEVTPAEETASQTQTLAETPATDVQAAFAVDNFSTFTITWQETGGYYPQRYFSVTVNYVDQDGYDVITETQNVVIPFDGPEKPGRNADTSRRYPVQITSDPWDLTQYQIDASQLTNCTGFNGIHLNSVGGQEVATVTVSIDGEYKYQRFGWFGDWTLQATYSLIFKDANGNTVSTITGTNANIYFVYQRTDSGSTGDSEQPDADGANIVTGKSTTTIPGTSDYKLELSLTGDRGQADSRQKLDVVFVLDVSGSMDKDYFGNDTWNDNNTRLSSAKVAINKIIGYGSGNDSGLSDDPALDVKYALVTFEGGNSNPWSDATLVTNGWVGLDAMGTAVNNVSANGGTNYEAGFRKTNELFRNYPSRNGAQRVVIFVSDGTPGYYYTDDGGVAGVGQPGSYDPNDHDEVWNAVKNAKDELSKLKTDYFFFVGVGSKSIDSAVYTEITATANVAESNKDSVATNSAEDLVNKFDAIKEQLTYFAANNVRVEDPLSDYADLVKGDDGKYHLTVKMEHRADSNGAYSGGTLVPVTIGENESQTVTIQNGGESVQLTLQVVVVDGKETIKATFPEDYRLKKNYRYVISTTITPSQEAIDIVTEEEQPNAENNTANDNVPDSGTGTHADKTPVQQGFWSNVNENALVTVDALRKNDSNQYEVSQKDVKAYFPKPVIQATAEDKTADLTITKDVKIAEGAFPAGGKDYKFTISTTASNVAGNQYKNAEGQIVTSQFTETSSGSGTYTAEVTVSVSTINATAPDATVTIVDLPEGTYTVTEQTAGEIAEIEDYELSIGYTVTDSDENTAERQTDNADVALSANDETPATVAVTNTYTHIPVTLNLKKVDGNNMETPLSGATFNLYYTENDQNKYYCTDGTWSIVTGDSGTNTKQAITSNNNGSLNIPALEVPASGSQVYYLQEVAAPAGYQLPSYTIAITITSTGNVTVYGSNQITNNDGVYLIPNSTGMELPETGGTGTTAMTIGGLLLLAAAAGGYELRRRRGRGAK